MKCSQCILPFVDISRLNDYLNLLCITAYIIRFVNNLKQNVKKQSLNLQFLQPVDIENAEFEWIRTAQKEFLVLNLISIN